MGRINDLVVFARSKNCSDVHLTAGEPCMFRIHGTLVPVKADFADGEVESEILSLCDRAQKEKLERGEDLDFAYETSDKNRQRVNIFRQQGKLSAAIRLLNDTVPSLSDLKLPPILETLADQPRGLVLVTGPTGSGKSTTLAAMIDRINASRPVHIITIEDPIEYVYTPIKALVHQREVGRDVTSFASALRSALREDPDVILVGEMRDYETISAAVTAAETGHLVLSTLHTTGAAQTIDRIVDACPAETQRQMRTQLSTILRGVVTQALLPLASGGGRIAATEVLVGTDAVLNLIRENKTYQLPSCMQSGGAVGMHTFDSDLLSYAKRGLIARETALSWAFFPKDIEGLL